MRLEKYKAEYAKHGLKIDPSLLAISEQVQVSLSEVLDQLNIHVDCCRMRLLSQVEFKDLY